MSEHATTNDRHPKTVYDGFVGAAGKDLHRLNVVSRGDGSSYLESILAAVERPVPTALADWEIEVDRFCDDARVGPGRQGRRIAAR